jgi:hypothetical protein
MLVLLMGEYMNYTVQMGLGVMIRPKFHKDWFRHSKINRRGDTHTDTHRNRKVNS